jgi:hypothetical protein
MILQIFKHRYSITRLNVLYEKLKHFLCEIKRLKHITLVYKQNITYLKDYPIVYDLQRHSKPRIHFVGIVLFALLLTVSHI